MDIKELINYLLTPMAQVALIIGLAELVKKAGLSTRWIPLVDVGLGLISGIVIFGITMGYGVINGCIVGIAEGLSACGLFSGIKNLMEKRETDERN